MDEQPAETSDSAEPHRLSYEVPPSGASLVDGMTRGDIACLVVKLIGIYQLAEALPGVAIAIGYFEYGGNVIAPLVKCAIYIGIGLVLLLKGDTVARWLMPRTAVVAVEPQGNVMARFQAIAFSVLGLWLFVWSFPELVRIGTALTFEDGSNAIQYGVKTRTQAALPSIIRYGVEVILGVWLFFGSKALSTWWWSLRHTEFTPVEPTDRPTDP